MDHIMFALRTSVNYLFIFLVSIIIKAQIILFLQGGANVSIQNKTLKNKIIGVWTYQEKSDLSYCLICQ